MEAALHPKFVSVKVVRAVNLAPKDSNGLSDPFVVVSFKRNGKEHDKKEKTAIIKKTLNPEWNETFAWPVVGDPLSDNDALHFMVWDDDLISNDFEGELEINLGQLSTAGTIRDSYLLKPRAGKKDIVNGELVLELTYSHVSLAATRVGGSDLEKEFVLPVWEGRWSDVFKTFHPDLSTLVDQDVFIARMNLYKLTLGHCIGTDYFNVNKGVTYQGGHKVITDMKALSFERGKAKIELKYLDGSLIGFTIESHPPPNGSISVPSATLYERAQKFFELFMDCSVEEATVYALLSDELKQSISKEAFSKMRCEFHKPGTGHTEAVRLLPGTDTQARVDLHRGESGTWEFCVQLHVTQHVDPSVRPDGKRTFPAEVTFAVAGWRLILLGFSASTNRSVEKLPEQTTKQA